jgi:hypothetical protein
MQATGTELRGWRKVLSPIRAFLELWLPADQAFNGGLDCLARQDYTTALRLFQVAERKFRRKNPAASDEVLAAQAGQAYSHLELARYAAAGTLATSVLEHMGTRTSVMGFEREAIESYRDVARHAISNEPG